MLRIFTLAIAGFALVACSQPANEAAAPTSPPPPPARSAEQLAQLVAALPAPYDQGNYEHGRVIAGQCRSCHTFTADGGNRVGPNLHGVFARKAGTAEGFNYSDAVKNANLTWDEASIDRWVTNPRTMLPGNRMSFPGVANPNDRRDLITFLKVETSN